MNRLTEDHRITARDAKPDDIRALAELHVHAFRQTHGGGPDLSLREQQWRSKFASGVLLFCVVLELPSGELIGFASGELHGGAELAEYGGELNKIYILREYQRRGLGRRLLCDAARRFLDLEIPSMLLFGDARSASNGFYEVMGGERLYASNGEFHGAYGWRDLRGLAAACSSTTATHDAAQ